MTINKLLAELSKKHGIQLGTMSDVVVPVTGLTTGNLAIDHITGCGGIPVGRITELYGLPSSGKTTTALQAAARLQARIIDRIHAGGSELDGVRGEDLIVYFDYENTLDGEYAANLGLDVEHPSFVLCQPDFLEQGGEIGLDLIKTGCVKLSIWDSVASMTPQATVDGDFDQRTSAMNRARLLNGMLMRFNGLLKHHRSAAIFLNHLTEAIDMGGRPGMPARVDTPGGKALKFYSSLRLEYRQLKQVKGKALNALTNDTAAEQVIAQHIKVKVVKNKVAPMAFRECEVRSRFGRGFDNTWSAVQVLLDHRRLARSGAWYSFDRMPALVHADLPRSAGGRHQLQGEAAIEAFAAAHPEWRRALITEAIDILATYTTDQDIITGTSEVDGDGDALPDA